MAIVIAVVSDEHAGSTLALAPASPIELDDGGSYTPSKHQLWLWERWQRYWEWVDEVRREVSGDLYVVNNGDLVDGDHHRTSQIVSRNPVVQSDIAKALLAVPLAMDPKHLFIVRGTEVHVGGSASTEESLAKSLGAVKDHSTGTHSWWHLKMEVEDVRLDFAHHGRTGFRPWTEANAVQLLAAQIYYEHSREDEARDLDKGFQGGRTYPHLAVRSHYHRHFDSGFSHPVRVVQTAAWQLKTAYVHRIATESISDIGGHVIIVDDGEYEVQNFISKPERAPTWRP
jgi:hypothetical protein